MKKDKSYEKWIEGGYDLLAHEGLEGVQIEKLARIVGLNKSGFYHYFSDRDGFLKQLMQYHGVKATELATDVSKAKNIDPEFIDVLLKYKVPVIVHMQLVRNRNNIILHVGFEHVNAMVDPTIVPLWADFVGLTGNHDLAYRHYIQIRDMFYSRITLENMNYEYLMSILMEARAVVRDVLKMNELDGPV
ncbi:MAG: TetR/AcrR family transcriptional regulator [Saprospiraceae bacterium]|nr:TetR/AcrR family transcriptional regulator [Saprospiraceae bacterium]